MGWVGKVRVHTFPLSSFFLDRFLGEHWGSPESNACSDHLLHYEARPVYQWCSWCPVWVVQRMAALLFSFSRVPTPNNIVVQLFSPEHSSRAFKSSQVNVNSGQRLFKEQSEMLLDAHNGIRWWSTLQHDYFQQRLPCNCSCHLCGSSFRNGSYFSSGVINLKSSS